MRYLLLTAILCIGVSCERHNSVASKTEKIVNTIEENVIQTLKGVWVKSDYIEDIVKTRSPILASDKLDGVVTLIIDPEKLSGDSLVVGISINNHEGDFFNVFLEQGQNVNFVRADMKDYRTKSNYFELGYELTAKDTLALLHKYDINNNLIEKHEFKRVCMSQDDNDAAYGLELVVNRLLFTGTYSFIDSLKQKKTVQLTDDGHVKGFGVYKEYYVITDFAVEKDFDEIQFDHQSYSYQFKGDTLKLFQILDKPTKRVRIKPSKFDLVKLNE